MLFKNKVLILVLAPVVVISTVLALTTSTILNRPGLRRHIRATAPGRKPPLMDDNYRPRLCKNVFERARCSKPDWKSPFYAKSTSADVPINFKFNVDADTSILAKRCYTLWAKSGRLPSLLIVERLGAAQLLSALSGQRASAGVRSGRFLVRSPGQRFPRNRK